MVLEPSHWVGTSEGFRAYGQEKQLQPDFRAHKMGNADYDACFALMWVGPERSGSSVKPV